MRREDLAALPYLDAVIREVLRLWSPAPNTIRKANEAVVIPLGTPIEGRDGKMIDSIKLNKGTQLFIRSSPILFQSMPMLIISDLGSKPVPSNLGSRCRDI